MKKLFVFGALLLAPVFVTGCILLYYNMQKSVESGWLTYIGSILSYYGTTIVSLIALDVSSREYKVNFQIGPVDHERIREKHVPINQAWHENVNDFLVFNEFETDPATLNAYKLTIKNYGGYPITKVKVQGTGYNETYRKTKILKRELCSYIKENDTYTFIIEYSPDLYDWSQSGVSFQVTCENIFKSIQTIELTTHHYIEQGQLKTSYSQRLLKWNR